MHVHSVAKPRLHVCSVGQRHYIEVPSRDGEDLLRYLRAHHVVARPPEPSSKGLDVIELRGSMHDQLIQQLLDRWE